MPVFLERFILPVCAAIIVILALTNPMKFDVTQRITGSLGIIFLAYFVAHTVYIHQSTKEHSESGPAVTQQKPIDTPEPTPKGEEPRNPKGHNAIKRQPSEQLTSKPLVSMSAGQRLVLIDRLSKFRGNTARLVLVGSEPQANVKFAQLENIFEQAGWKIQSAQIGSVTTVGVNFPSVTYLTGPNMSADLLENVFSIFATVGIDLPMTPQAFMGPSSMGSPPEVVIVIR